MASLHIPRTELLFRGFQDNVRNKGEAQIWISGASSLLETPTLYLLLLEINDHIGPLCLWRITDCNLIHASLHKSVAPLSTIGTLLTNHYLGGGPDQGRY